MVTLAKDRLHRSLRGLHRDEGGMEALQVVLIVAIAAAILVFAYNVIWNGTGGIKASVNSVLSIFVQNVRSFQN